MSIFENYLIGRENLCAKLGYLYAHCVRIEFIFVKLLYLVTVLEMNN